MKRPLLIANGAFVGLTLVLTITPPEFGSQPIAPVIPTTPTPDKTVVYVPSTNLTSKPTKSPTISQPTTNPVTITPAPVATKTVTPEPTAKLINGSFTGDPIDISYGIMQIKITVQDSKIVDVQAVQYPNSGKSGQLNAGAIATLRQETLSAQSASINGVSGASYTSYGFYKSLVSAIAKSGL